MPWPSWGRFDRTKDPIADRQVHELVLVKFHKTAVRCFEQAQHARVSGALRVSLVCAHPHGFVHHPNGTPLPRSGRRPSVSPEGATKFNESRWERS